jgi:hypothetical protein
VVFVLILAALILPSVAHAQREARFGRGAWFGGASLAVQPTGIREFSNSPCPMAEVIPGIHAGFLPLRWLSVAMFARLHSEGGPQCVTDVFVPPLPPPDSGTTTFNDYSDLEGYPYGSTGLRVTGFNASASGAAFRVFAGGEWLPSKSVIAPFFGAGVGIPAGKAILVVEAETRILSADYEAHVSTYRQGQVVSERTEQRHSDFARLALRLGVEFPIAR